MDARALSALDLGWRLVHATLAGLCDLAGQAAGWLPGPVWSRAFAQLRRAEAAARRLLLVLAENLAAETAAEPRPARAPAAKSPATGPKTPGFALFDPLPEPGVPAPCDAATGWAAEPVPHSTQGLAPCEG